MKELLSYETVRNIVDEAGYNGGIADYKNWSSDQFLRYIADVVHRSINAAFAEASKQSKQ